jgi:hypothetical protein
MVAGECENLCQGTKFEWEQGDLIFRAEGVRRARCAVRPFRFRFTAEDEFQLSALHQFVVGYVTSVERFTVEQHIFYKIDARCLCSH